MFESPFSSSVSFVCVSAVEQPRVLPEEFALLSDRATEKRRRQFALGRHAGRTALEALNVDSSIPILKGTRGEPVWPDGYVGSISHTDDFAVAAVARESEVSGLGIDLQSLETETRERIIPHVCNDQESSWVKSDPEFLHSRLVSLFSAKESVYKAFYPACKRSMGFRDVSLRWVESEERFRGTLNVHLSDRFSDGFLFVVESTFGHGLILSSLVLPSSCNSFANKSPTPIDKLSSRNG